MTQTSSELTRYLGDTERLENRGNVGDCEVAERMSSSGIHSVRVGDAC